MVAKKLVCGVFALAVLGSVGTWGAARADDGWDGPRHGHYHGGGFFTPHVPAFIALSEAQKTQIQQICQQGRADWQAQFEQSRALHEKIRAALAAQGALDRTLLANLVQQENVVHAQGAQERLALLEKVHDVLTPEQRKQVVETTRKIHALHDQLRVLSGHDLSGHDNDERGQTVWDQAAHQAGR